MILLVEARPVLPPAGHALAPPSNKSGSLAMFAAMHPPCPLWVKSCRGAVKVACPLYPRKLPRHSLTGTAVKGHKPTSTGGDLRPSESTLP
jgi:hypothetical protein